MYLVKDRQFGMDRCVFTHTDPRTEGYRGDVAEKVNLDYDMNRIHSWPDGERACPELGQDQSNPNFYKVFKFPAERNASGFALIGSGAPFVFYSWADYRDQINPPPERFAPRLTGDEYFNYLEDADAVVQVRKATDQNEPLPDGANRDQVAEWVARQQMDTDGSIQQVWFLPTGTNLAEIRLLEVSERYTGDPDELHPVRFWIDVNGGKYRVAVVDITNDRLAKIRSNPSNALPEGWTINNARGWSRRGPIQ